MTAVVAAPPGVAAVLRRKAARRGAGRWYPAVYWTGGVVFAAVVVALVVSMADGSALAFARRGPAFLWSTTWQPDAGRFAAGTLVVGTVVTTAVGMALAVPVGIGVAVALSEMAPRRLAGPVGAAVESLAAVPSIVFGLWALLVLSPVFASTVEPWLSARPGLHELFGGPALGPSILLAAVVLAAMTLPTIVALSRSALASVPGADREAALALGATRWQVIRTAVLPGARSGLTAAVILAVGRALGESIAVALVIGNRPAIPHSLTAPGATLGSAIVNQFAEAPAGLQASSVVGLGVVLLVLTVAVNAGGQAFLRRGRRQEGPAPRGPVTTGDPAAETLEAIARRRPDTAGFSGAQAAATRSLGRRRLADRAASAAFAAAVFAGIAPLVAVLYFTVDRGVGAVSAAFLTHGPRPPEIPGGGISTAITGTARVVGWGLVGAVPVGLAAALLIYERSGRIAAALRFGAEVLTGVPSVLIGIFAYTVLVEPRHHASTAAAAFALAVLMVPVMIRADEEALRAVPTDLWEAGMALGASRAAVARRVVLRQALPGLVSANLLAAARGVGETAPLLFTVAAPTSALSLVIFTQATQAYPSAQRTAWGAALVLLVAVLVLTGAARAAAAWLHRRAS